MCLPENPFASIPAIDTNRHADINSNAALFILFIGQRTQNYIDDINTNDNVRAFIVDVGMRDVILEYLHDAVMVD